VLDYMLAATLTMGILNLTCFNNAQRARYFAAVLSTEILIAVAGYLVLWLLAGSTYRKKLIHPVARAFGFC
jgi:hypothetical protein